ncbi:uncharacterized protein LOC135470573 isoform X1 [Liolophura sinensis]|uniref:uncharacterized protein LOC135470573 isoform X1 n=1 Tax=Liolophura sinensis TaxID=3198878 RepID=UPI00315909CB
MGVTLERVQYKFASIIGELCSEPDILSQFAVWVDLRLAEYKLKGSISLDCSGETPDPIWLKGILSALIAKRLAKGKAAVLSSSKCMLATGEDQKVKSLVKLQTPVIRISGPRSAQQTVEPQVTIPPNFIVKGEPEEEKVYPQVSFQDHAYLGDIIRRKRAAETVSSESPKRERVETIPSSQSIVLPDDFQSIPRQVVADEGVTTLLDTASPITGSEYLPAATNETPSPDTRKPIQRGDPFLSSEGKREFRSETVYKKLYQDLPEFDDFILAGDTSSSLSAEQTLLHQDPSSLDYSLKFPLSPGKLGSSFEDDTSFQESLTDEEIRLDQEPSDHSSLQHQEVQTADSYNTRRSVRIPAETSTEQEEKGIEAKRSRKYSPKDRKRQELLYMRKTFERWVRETYPGETRKCESIPPEELDPYLTHFFSVIKNRNGEDYDHGTFRKFQGNMNQYLKECGYPSNITTSKLFVSSQMAFADRRDSLKNRQLKALTLCVQSKSIATKMT